jgi:hypothetical protein
MTNEIREQIDTTFSRLLSVTAIAFVIGLLLLGGKFVYLMLR